LENRGNKVIISNSLIRKYFSGEADSRENKLIHDWIPDPSNETEVKSKLREHWNEIGLEHPSYREDAERILGKLNQEIIKNSLYGVQSITYIRKIYQQFSKIAAVLILPALFICAWYFIDEKPFSSNENSTVYAEYFTPDNGRAYFDLPDGSRCWLNNGSRIKFPAVFNDKIREVSLSGEGYFEVKTDADRPFIVKTQNFEVKALGTAFNVFSYSDDSNIEVTLESGEVGIDCLYTNGRRTRLADLKPDQQLVISKDKNTKLVRQVDSHKYNSWTEGKLVFRNDNMAEVVRRLSRWYNVDIILADDKLYEYSYRATFQNEDLNEVLKYLVLTSPIDYKEADREIQSDSMVSKKKIILYYKE